MPDANELRPVGVTKRDQQEACTIIASLQEVNRNFLPSVSMLKTII
jgi:hypothetical protein